MNTINKLLGDVKPGDEVTIHNADGKLIRIGRVSRVLATKITAAGNDYSIRTGQGLKNGNFFARPADEDKIALAEAELEQRNIDEQAERDRQRKAEYDALPKSVKLARKLQHVADLHSSDKIAECPIEILQAFVNWAEKHNFAE